MYLAGVILQLHFHHGYTEVLQMSSGAQFLNIPAPIGGAGVVRSTCFNIDKLTFHADCRDRWLSPMQNGNTFVFCSGRGPTGTLL